MKINENYAQFFIKNEAIHFSSCFAWRLLSFSLHHFLSMLKPKRFLLDFKVCELNHKICNNETMY